MPGNQHILPHQHQTYLTLPHPSSDRVWSLAPFLASLPNSALPGPSSTSFTATAASAACWRRLRRLYHQQLARPNSNAAATGAAMTAARAPVDKPPVKMTIQSSNEAMNDKQLRRWAINDHITDWHVASIQCCLKHQLHFYFMHGEKDMLLTAYSTSPEEPRTAGGKQLNVAF